MAEGKKEKIIEGEVVDKKSASGRANQYVSEKTVALIAVVIILIVGGYFAYDPVKDWIVGFGEKEATPEPTQATSAVDANQDRLAQLAKRIAALENVPGQTGTPDYEQRLLAIEASIKALAEYTPSEGQTATPDPRIGALEKELAALRAEVEQRPGAESAANATFAQAVAVLSPPLYQSLPFEGQLEQVRILVLEMPTLSQATLSEPLAVLSGFSKAGVPSLSSLTAGFEDASIEAFKVEGLPEDAGWWDKTWARFKGLVVVRRTDGGGGTALEETLAQALKDFEAGNLAAAMDLISALPPREGEAFKPWLEDARKRRQALEAYTKLIEFIPVTARKGDGG